MRDDGSITVEARAQGVFCAPSGKLCEALASDGLSFRAENFIFEGKV